MAAASTVEELSSVLVVSGRSPIDETADAMERVEAGGTRAAPSDTNPPAEPPALPTTAPAVAAAAGVLLAR